MSRSSPARLAKLLSDIVAIDKARLALLAVALADAAEGHTRAVEALSAPRSLIPPGLAALSCRAMEQRIIGALQEVSRAEKTLLDDGCQLKLFEGRAARVMAQEAAATEREQLAGVIERLADSPARV